MSEQQLQFRVGLFAICAMSIAGVLVFQFGKFRSLLEKNYQVHVHFESAPGILPGAPVRLNGLSIGSVKDLQLDPERGGVLLTLNIEDRYRLRSDSKPMLQQSLLGDATIEFMPGSSPQEFDPNSVLEGEPPFDMTAIVRRMDQQITVTMSSFEATSQEWRRLAANVNGLVETNSGNLRAVVERTAVTLDEFTRTMASAGKAFENTNRVIGDPQTIANMQKALNGLPQLVVETQQTISAMRQTVTAINGNLQNIENVTEPLAKHTTSIVMRLDQSLANLEALTGELRNVAELASKNDGSFKRLLTDPQLYDNLERSALSLSVMMRNLEPVIRDMRIFSDKVARHPEILGVRGALSPSDGLKDNEIRQTGLRE